MVFSWLILSATVMLVASQSTYYQIDVDDVYTINATNISLILHYNISSDVILTCSTSAYPSIETTIELEVSKDTAFVQLAVGSATAVGVYQVTCAEGEDFTVTAIVTVIESIPIALCSDKQLFNQFLEVKIGQLASSEPQIECTCTEGTDQVLEDFVFTPQYENLSLNITWTTNNCNVAQCPCTLECTDSSDSNYVGLSTDVIVSSPGLYVRKLFEKVTMYQQGLFIAYVYPIKNNVNSNSITCSVYNVQIVEYVVQEFGGDPIGSFNVSRESNYVYKIHPKNDTIASGVYGVKCTATELETTFVFEFTNTPASNIDSDKLNFDEFVSVDCACDTTARFCDRQCCCDTDCSDLQKEAFGRCIPGSFGGDETVTIVPDCSDIKNVSPWERALCIKTSNSAFLGTYFNFVNESLVSDNKWNDTNIVGLLDSDAVTGVKGSLIFTHSEEESKKGILSLPGSVGGACVAGQPLKLFQNTRVQCRRAVSCGSHSVLHARSYLSPTVVLVDPCKWYTSVYSGGLGSAAAAVKVYYEQENETVNHLTAAILQDEACRHSVTGVDYQVTVQQGSVTALTATLSLEDLSGREGDSIVTRYTVNYLIKEANITAASKTSDVGYNAHDSLVGSLLLPEYGDCKNPGSVPKFKVSRITQCYVDVSGNCQELFEELIDVYARFIVNGTEVAATLGSDARRVSATITNVLDTATFTEEEFCDHLPSRLHIQVLHENNTESGSTITGISFYMDYTGAAMVSESRAMLYLDLQYLVADVADPASVWGELFLEEGLLNTLLIILAGLLYLVVPRTKLDPFRALM